MAEDIVVYTAIFGGYDTLKPTMFPSLCFTDGNVPPVPGWEYKTILAGRDGTWSNRHCKILAHKYLNAEYSIYHDGNIQLLVDPHTIVERYLHDTDLALFAHPARNCIYDEAEVNIRLKKAKANAVRPQMDRYRQEGYPAKNGLVACWVIVRRHTEVMERFNEAWWTEWEKGTPRDQLSFNYVCWKLGVKYNIIPGNLRKGTSEIFKREPHERETRKVVDWRTAYGQVLLKDERRFLKDTATQIQAEFGGDTVIINIGVFRCASMYCLRAGAPEATVIGIDIRPCDVAIDPDLNATFIIADSAKCHTQIESPVNLLFIDGDHHYRAVKADLEGWASKIPVGGIVIMHDYAPQPKHLASLPELEGVRRAVNEWAEKAEWQRLPAPDSLAAFRRLR